MKLNKVNIPPDIFYLNPAKQHLVTGKRSLTRFWLEHWPLWAAILFIGWICSDTIVILLREYRLSERKTASVAGKIVSCLTQKKVNRSLLFYRLEIQKQSFEEVGEIDSCDGMIIGNDIQVTYATDDPSISHIGPPGFKWPAIISNAIFVGFMIFIAITVQVMIAKGKLKRKQNDQIIFGRLKRCKKVLVGRAGLGSYCLVISFHFLAPNGSPIAARARCIRNDIKELPGAGRSVAILYTSHAGYSVI